jgi:uncharacterized protein (TIGR01244 family)
VGGRLVWDGAAARLGSETAVPHEDAIPMQERAITPAIVVADQPSEAEIADLAGRGFVGVVNLRQSGEPEQPLDPAAEQAVVKTHGLAYLSEPVGAAPLARDAVGRVLDFIDEQTRLGGKVLVHCRKGARAAALVLLHQARAENWPASEVFARGQEIGLTVEGHGLRALVENYLASS